MTAIQQTVEIDLSRRILRLEEPLPESISPGRADIILVLQSDAPVSRPQASLKQSGDVYAGIPSALPDDLLRSQIDLLEKVEW
ncbi:MAG: hypothetical protein LBL44_13375 [Treponema sp.]|jgi:hypothetical protein|nr:hypothetical protein [Treponema sp.]